MAKKFDVIVFDLGGVLLDISGVQDILNWRGNCESLPEFWLNWINSRSVRAFESGVMTDDDFIANIVSEFELPISPETFKQSYCGWIKGIFDGIPEILTQLKSEYRLACLTNTNTLHWPEVEASGILTYLDLPFVSFKMGEVKPEAAIYQKMLAILNVPAERVLFIDDNQINVDAALSCGIQAYRVVGVDQVKNCLQEQGII